MTIASVLVVFVMVFTLISPAIAIEKSTASEEAGIVLDQGATNDAEAVIVETDAAQMDAAVTEEAATDTKADVKAEKASEATSAAVEETEDDADEIAMPEQNFEKELKKEGITVYVKAEEGALPKGTTMEVEAVDDKDVLDKISAEAEKKADKDTTIGDIQAVDISFWNDGKEIEPEENVYVTIASDLIKDTDEQMIIHVNDTDSDKVADNQKGKAEVVKPMTEKQLEKKDITPAEDEIVFEADQFSVYGIVGTEVISGGDETFNITQDGWTVTVHTPEGAFPSGTEMRIERVSDPEVLVKLMSALDSRKVYDIAAVDISFFYKGEEIEPAKKVDVTLKSNLLSADQYQIVHLKNDEEAEIIRDASTEYGKAEFTLDSFSPVASAIEQDHVDKSAFKAFDGSTNDTYISGQPANDLTPGAPASVVPVIPGYVFVNATINDGTTGEVAASNVEVTYFGSFISDGITYVYYRTETDTMDLIVHVQDNEFIQLNYLPEDNYYNINYRIEGDKSETSVDEVFGTDRTTRAVNNSSDIGYTVTIPRGYTATVTRNGTTVATLGVEPTYTVFNNKIITKNGELTLTDTYTIPKTNTDQNIVVTLTKRTSYTFDASKFLSTVYTGGNSTTMGDNTVNTNSSARIQGDGTLGRSGTNKGKKAFTGNEVSWTFTTNNTENSHWLLDALQINGTDINVPYGDSGPVTKTTELPSGAVVTVTLNSVTGTGRNARRNYTITVSNVYEDVVISGGNIYNADNSVEIITEVLSNVDYSFYGFSSSDNAYSSSVLPGWVSWGEGEPIGELTSGSPQNSGTYHMYWFGNNTTNNGMRFTVKPGYINPELAFVTSTERDLHNYVNGLSFGSMSDENGKYYPITSSPNSNGYYVFTITGMGSNKLALLRIRAELAEYGVTYSSGGVTTTAGTMPENDYGYNVENKDTIVLSSNIPVDSSGNQTFSYYWTIQGGGNTQYAPGQSIPLADVAQYAVEDEEGNLVIPFVAHWTPKSQAKQVNYRIEYWVDGNDPSTTDDDVMKFFYSMLAPEGSAIYVNKNSDYIQNFLEVYHGLLEYDEENSASYVGNLQEGDIVKLRFQWVRHPLIIEKEVDSVNTTDYNKDFEMSLSSHREVVVPKYDESTATIDPGQTETKTDNESWDNFTLKNAKTQEFSVMREATVDFEELESSWIGFHEPTYILTTYEEDGTTVKEERTVTKQDLSAIKVTEKMKVTVKNERGRVQVSKNVEVVGDGITTADVNDTIYFALKKHGQDDFVQKNGSIYTIPVVITAGVASPATITFTGIEDGEYEVWELSDTNGTSKNVGDVFESNGKVIQVSEIYGITSKGEGNNITISNNDSDWARFTNTYTDASEHIFFRARKRWMDNEGNVGNQYAPNGGSVEFTIYRQDGTTYTPIESVTLDGTPDTDPKKAGVYGWESSRWWARFDNLPRLDSNGNQIKYVVKETSAPAGYVPYKAVGTSAENEMGPNDYLENNGGTIYNRRVGQGLIIKKIGDDAAEGLAGATFTLDTVEGNLTTGDDGIAIDSSNNSVFTLPIREGTYTLSEIGVPTYYNGISDIEIAVTDSGISLPEGTTGAIVTGPNDNGAYTITVTNTKKTANVTVIKNVANGSAADKRKSYSFTASGLTESGITLYGEHISEEKSNTKTYSGIPFGTAISVTESDEYKDFDTSIEITYADGTKKTKNTLSTGDITLEGDTTITFTNTRRTADIVLIKDDGKGNLLDKARFTLALKDSNTNAQHYVNGEWVDIGSGDKHDFEVTGGQITIEGLPVGDYILTETAAPNGYIILSNKVEFSVSRSGENVTIAVTSGEFAKASDNTLTISNIPGEELPNTGGPGTRLFTILGSIMVAGAGILLWRRRRTV